MNWRDLGLVAVGGALGSSARYAVGRLMGLSADRVFPWHTFVVNITGAFLIGILFVAAPRLGVGAWWRPFLAVGILGGYTTFSTFSLETVEMALHGRLLGAAAYVALSVVAGVTGCALGIWAARAI